MLSLTTKQSVKDFPKQKESKYALICLCNRMKTNYPHFLMFLSIYSCLAVLEVGLFLLTCQGKEQFSYSFCFLKDKS